MENQIILSASTGTSDRVNNISSIAAEALRRGFIIMNMPVRMLRRYYALVLEREVSMYQARVLTTAQVAFIATVLPADYPLLLRCAFCAWFVKSLLTCRRVM